MCRKCGVEYKNKSVHCIECDVCVEEYDHHCVWTGKCIGKGNIRYFNLFIGSTVILLLYCIVMTVIYLGSKNHSPSN